jgi:hypothetical protein
MLKLDWNSLGEERGKERGGGKDRVYAILGEKDNGNEGNV